MANERKHDVKYDVVVCGGGTAGTAAAVAAARGGAKTLLIERNGALGGQMNVSGPPGFSYANLFNGYNEQVIAGFAEEMHARLLKEGHAYPHDLNEYRTHSGYTFSYVDPDWWGLEIFEVMTEEGVDLLLHTLVVDVQKDGDKVNGVVVENANGRLVIEAKVVIDCTGEGDIAVRAGCDYELLPREECEPQTICFTMGGVDWDEMIKYVHENPDQILYSGPEEGTCGDYPPRSLEEHYEIMRNITNIMDYGDLRGFFKIMDEALKNGDWHPYSGVGFFLMPREGGEIQAHMQHSSQVPNIWSCDAWDLTKAEIECRHQCIIALKFFRKYMPGFKNAYLVRIGTELRLREGRRIMGDYKITASDVVEGRRFYDCIGKNQFAAGAIHVATNETITTGNGEIAGKPPKGGTSDIPYRCMVPLKVENFLVAGKHVSTDRGAYMRFLMQTVVTGQAAGVAAGLCVKYGVTPREIEDEKYVKEMQAILKKQGAILDGVH